jgi:hypothetical protein
MTRLICCLLLSAIALLADVTGKWSGSFDVAGPDGQTNANTAVMNFKQDGSSLTGTAGPSDGEQMNIRAGKIDGDKITFEVALENGPVIKFDLALAGDHIKGTANGEADGQKLSAKVDVTRQ